MRSPNNLPRGPAAGPQPAVCSPGEELLAQQVIASTGGKVAVSVPQMAEMLGISRTTAYQLARRSDFPAFNVGNRTLVSVPGLIRWVSEQVGQEGGGT